MKTIHPHKLVNGVPVKLTKQEILEHEQREKEHLEKLSRKPDYKTLRKQAYPSIEDQLDILYHKGLPELKKVIKEVKDRFPKDE